jgi:ribosome recycling factor
MDKAVEHTRVASSPPCAPAGPRRLVEKLLVDYYGTEVPLQQLAGFRCPRPALLVVAPTTRAHGRHREGHP